MVKKPEYSIPSSSSYASPAAPPPPTGYDYEVADDTPKSKSKPTPGPYYYKPVEQGPHEGGTYVYKPVESEAAAVASPTTSYASSPHSGSCEREY